MDIVYLPDDPATDIDPYFYSSMKILNDGMYQRINVSGGIIWEIHYVHMAAVL